MLAPAAAAYLSSDVIAAQARSVTVWVGLRLIRPSRPNPRIRTGTRDSAVPPELNVHDNPPCAGGNDRHEEPQTIARRRDRGLRESRCQPGLHLLCGAGSVAGALLDLQLQPSRCARCGSVQILPACFRVRARKVHGSAPSPGGGGEPGEVELNVGRYFRLAIRHRASVAPSYGGNLALWRH